LSLWYRRKYNLPPNDPLFLAITDEEIALEYEYDLMAQGEKLKTCPRCEGKTHQRWCPVCTIDGKPLLLTGDRLADEVQSRIAAGEELDLNEIFRVTPGGFEPVPRG